MFRISERDLIWESNDIITHVPGDSGSISDIKYINIDRLPVQNKSLDLDNVERIMQQFQEDPGSVQSVVIYDNPDTGKWQIVDGAHRLEAARRLNIPKAPVRFIDKKEGLHWRRDLDNYIKAWKSGNYHNENELKYYSKMLIEKNLEDMTSNESTAMKAVELLIYLKDFNLMLQSLPRFSRRSPAYKKLEDYIGENY